MRMIRVTVRFLGVFRSFSKKNQISLTVKQGNIKSIIMILAKSLSPEARQLLIDAELNDPRPNALVLLNGKEIDVLNGLETEVKEGDEITLIPVSHGG